MQCSTQAALWTLLLLAIAAAPEFIGIILFVVVFCASIIIGYPYQVLAVFVSFYILSGILKHIITLGNIEPKNQET